MILSWKTEYNALTKQSGDEGGRTPDLLNAIQALYQLSYIPNEVRKEVYLAWAVCQPNLAQKVLSHPT
jgi:rhamnogalacturonyl hydrolase YesR